MIFLIPSVAQFDYQGTINHINNLALVCNTKHLVGLRHKHYNNNNNNKESTASLSIEKSVFIPTQKIQRLRLIWDTKKQTLSLPQTFQEVRDSIMRFTRCKLITHPSPRESGRPSNFHACPILCRGFTRRERTGQRDS